MEKHLRGFRRQVSVQNANGDQQCAVQCIDLVDDRVRKRWTALAILFAFLSPFLSYLYLGRLNTTWNRGDTDPSANVSAPSLPRRSHTWN